MPDQTNQQMLGSSGTIVPSKVYVVGSESENWSAAALLATLH